MKLISIIYEPLPNGMAGITMDQFSYFCRVISSLEDLISQDVRNYTGERAFNAIENILQEEIK